MSLLLNCHDRVVILLFPFWILLLFYIMVPLFELQILQYFIYNRIMHQTGKLDFGPRPIKTKEEKRKPKCCAFSWFRLFIFVKRRTGRTFLLSIPCFIMLPNTRCAFRVILFNRKLHENCMILSIFSTWKSCLPSNGFLFFFASLLVLNLGRISNIKQWKTG